MKHFFILLFAFTTLIRCQGQQMGISLSNNVTSFPVTGIPKAFYSQLHPGIDIFRDWKINKKEKNQFFFVANAGGYYHRFIQTAVRIYGTVEYRYIANSRLSILAGIGGGYLHSFENMAVLKLTSDGKYEKVSSIVGRPQVLAQLNIGCSYALKKDDPQSKRIFFQMRTFLQGPFVNNYVPFAPLNSIAIGISVPLKCKKDEE
jgi:hypothetical protein